MKHNSRVPLLCLKINNKSFADEALGEKEALKDATVALLRKMHGAGMLSVEDMLSIVGHDSEYCRVVCENAVKAMWEWKQWIEPT